MEGGRKPRLRQEEAHHHLGEAQPPLCLEEPLTWPGLAQLGHLWRELQASAPNHPTFSAHPRRARLEESLHWAPASEIKALHTARGPLSRAQRVRGAGGSGRNLA